MCEGGTFSPIYQKSAFETVQFLQSILYILTYIFKYIQSKSGYFDIGFFCPIVFCRQVSVNIVLFVIQLECNWVFCPIALFCLSGV